MNGVSGCSLGDLLTLQRRPIKVVPDAQYAEIGIYSFGRGIFHKQPRSGLEVGDKDLFLVTEGDFILHLTFAWEGAVGLASAAEDGMYGSVRFPTFRVDENRCFPPYLVNYFRTPEGRAQLVSICPGSAGRNRVLNLKRIPEVHVPLPPTEEQRRIVARIDELAGKIEEARGLRRQADAELEALCRSIIFDERNGAHAISSMRDLVGRREPDVVVRGEEMYQFAGVYCFGRGVFRGQRKDGTEFSYARLTRLRTGDFVYPKLMAWEGALGIVPPECDGLVVSPEFPVFEVDQRRVLPEVLDIYFRTPSVWPILAGVSTGTNVRRRRLNPSEFMAFRMPLPPMQVQLRLREVMSDVGLLKRLQAETAAELDALLPAVLDKAFRGEL